ncbi:MAG: DUF2254 domain-containing protein [Desulfobacterales bacterium]
MDLKIRNFWYRLKASFWFLPALIAGAAILLSFVTIAIDRLYLGQEGLQLSWIYSGGPDGARTVLSVIAGSMITVAGVVFSITIVVLSLASSQFGPRLIRNFMNVKANQMVLGTFVATFIYGILVLRTVDASAGAKFVPSLSVSVAVVMSLLSLGVLIYFINSVSESIQAQHIIARVRDDMDRAVKRIFPQKIGGGTDLDGPVERDYEIPNTCDSVACQVRAERSGYLQALDGEALMKIAVEHNLLIHLGHRPGDFITRHGVLVTVWPGDVVDENLSKKIHANFIVGSERTLDQDVEFAISQLVEIAVRALSPGINDPITAITCIDWLGAILCQLANLRLPPSHRHDEQGRLRVISKTHTFEGLVDAAFNMIRQNSETVAAVSIHLLETIVTVADQTVRKKDRTVLLRHAAMVADGCRKNLSADEDRSDLERQYKAAVKALGEDPAGGGGDPDIKIRQQEMLGREGQNGH